MKTLIRQLFYYLRDTISIIDIGYLITYEGHTNSGLYFRGEARALIITNFYKKVLQKRITRYLNERVQDISISKDKGKKNG